MKYILSVLFLFFFFSGFSQIYQEMPQYGYRANRMAFDSTLQIPTVCGVPTLKSVVSVNKKAALAFDSCNNKFYTYNPKTLTWSEVSGGGATQSLQDVTDVGNTTNNQIIINNNNNYGFFHKSNNILGIRTYVSEDDNESFMEVFSPVDNTVKSLYSQSSIQYVQSNNRTSIGYETPTQINNIIVPNSSGRLALSVNGQFADSAGSITIPTIDTSNKWVNDVVKKNDSTITVYKGSTSTDITLTPSATVTAATRLVTTVYNNSGSTITKGSVVYINGRHSSNLPTIALAQANTEANSYSTFALVQDDITNGNSGTVIQAGNISNLNLPTASYSDGQIVYLSPTVAGGITVNKNSVLAPNHIVKLGTIIRAHPTLGSIELKIENGWQLDELSDVKIAAVPNDSTLLQFSRVDSLWHDVSVTNAIGNKYLKPTDSVSLSNRINLKVNIADTATMLSPYLRSNTASATYLAKSDSTIYYTKYRSDTSRTNIYNALLGKQGTLTLTTTGTSGASTLIGNTLNIPQYSGGTSYTFSTGLTNTSGTVTNNLSTGVSGGQSVVGGTAASNSLTLSSTTNATKGKILFGTSAYDEVNNRLGIGTASPSHPFQISSSVTASSAFANLGFINGTLNAAANNDTMIALYVNPTFSVGSFTNTVQLASRFNGNVLMGQLPGNIYTYPPLTLCNNLNANLKTQLSLVNGGGNAGAGSAIDFFTYTDAGNGNPGVRLAGVDDGNFSGDFKIFTKAQGSSGNGALTEKFQIKGGTGNVLIGTTSDAGYKLNVNGTTQATQFKLSALNTAPATSTSTGTTGEIRIVNGYIYVCVATNTWQRATLSTF